MSDDERLQAVLSAIPSDRADVIDELSALDAIYGPNAIEPAPAPAPDTITFLVHTTCEPQTEVELNLLVALPTTYPSDFPAVVLQARFIESYLVDTELSTAIAMALADDASWEAETPALYEAVERARTIAGSWLQRHRDATLVSQIERAEDHPETPRAEVPTTPRAVQPQPPTFASAPQMPDGLAFVTSEPIVDRKSVFVGHAVALADPSQVRPALDWLLSDPKIARAAHNMWAYRCRVDGTLHQDNDDDGESAAGSRLSHLLSILQLDNALVVVTRHYGGIHLGSTRFKHIGEAARSALDAAGLLTTRTK